MSRFTAAEWGRIRDTLNAGPQRCGLPQRVYGSAVLATFNIRRLGAKSKRDARTWRLLADILGFFDLVALQEVLEDRQGSAISRGSWGRISAWWSLIPLHESKGWGFGGRVKSRLFSQTVLVTHVVSHL